MRIWQVSRSLACLLVLVAPSAAQTTWYVDASAPPPGTGTQLDPYPEIQTAIAAATTLDGDLVLAAPGAYVENLDLLGKAITVQADGPPGSVIVDGAHAGPVVRFVSGEGPGSQLVGLRLINGTGEPGAGGSLAAGGGIAILGGSPTIVDCEVVGNGDGSFLPQYGGGMFIENGSPSITGTRFVSNFSCSEGGGVAIFGGTPTFDDCEFSSNITNSFPGHVRGGGLYTTGMPTITNSSFANNLSDRGGAIAGPAHVQDSTFTGNQSSWGGALYQVTLAERCSLQNNRTECYFAESGLGGGAAAESTLSECTITGNVGTYGGALLDCIVMDSVISDNRADYTGNCFGVAQGGGAKNCTLIRCTVTGNWVDLGFGLPFSGSGGGLDGGSAEQSLFADNFADYGGGVANATLDRCTVVGNDVRFSAGGAFAVDASSSIVAFNANGQVDLTSSTVVWSVVPGGFPGTGNQDADPELWAPLSGADHRLKPGSPAIDAGDPTLPLDADGTTADVGAFPFDPTHVGTPGSYCTSKISSFGCAPAIGWSGTASLASGDFVLHFAGVQPDLNGLAFVGLAPAALPFLGGTLCVSPPLRRTPIQDSGDSGGPFGCGGSYDFALDPSFLATLGAAPYASAYAQGWHRDPNQADGTGVVLTRALELVLLP